MFVDWLEQTMTAKWIYMNTLIETQSDLWWLIILSRTLWIFNILPSLKGAIKLQHLIKHSKWREKKHSCLNPAWTYIQTVTFRISSKLHFTAQINRKIVAKQTHKFKYAWFTLCAKFQFTSQFISGICTEVLCKSS